MGKVYIDIEVCCIINKVGSVYIAQKTISPCASERKADEIIFSLTLPDFTLERNSSSKTVSASLASSYSTSSNSDLTLLLAKG